LNLYPRLETNIVTFFGGENLKLADVKKDIKPINVTISFILLRKDASSVS
jgi:hypothetical protein